MAERITLPDFLESFVPVEKECAKFICSCLFHYRDWDRTNYFWTGTSSWNGKFFYELFADDIGLKRVEELFDECIRFYKKHTHFQMTWASRNYGENI